VTRPFLASLSLPLFAAGLTGQALDPAKLLQPPTDTWPTYNGDYSGRRFSPLAKIRASNVKAMTLAWVYRVNTEPGGDDGELGGAQIKSTPLEVNGVLYFTIPDHVWAADARTGRELWHYHWKTKGGIHIGNRGVGIYRDWLYFQTPDNYLVCLNAKDGSERWRVEIADVKQEYLSTPAPMVIRNHLLVGVGGDSLDLPGYLESRDPETGKLQWRWNTTPRPGEPGAETWPNQDAMEHGGGMTWMPGTYDPELNLYYLGTGNPNPVLAGQGRQGANLWTCSIVALNPDTGKLVWYFQASPHDTHDWDAVQNSRPDRRGVPRTASQAPGAGEPQRLLLSPGSDQRQEPGVATLYRDQLVERSRPEGAADSGPGQGAQDRWDIGHPRCGRRGELAASELPPRDGPAIREHVVVV